MVQECLLLHKYKEIKSTSKYCYLECVKCGKRKIKEIRRGGYQPIDATWINNSK